MASRNRKNFKGGPRNAKNDGPTNVDTNNPVIQQFQIYSTELDDKADRHERLVKLSRDITIESKRIIFLLHTIDIKKNNKASVLEEAEQRIEKLCKTNFASIATELHGLDPYQYIRAVSAGIQEFIEAYTFCEYLQEKPLSDWEDLRHRLTYRIESDDQQSFNFNIVPSEFVLGLADLTGEIMRNCINSLGSGDTENCVTTCKFLQTMYSKFLSLSVVPNRGRDFSQKISTMRASTLKCEHVCYNLVIRGSEGSKMISFESVDNNDFDEGFCP